jgi:hypothetical protein
MNHHSFFIRFVLLIQVLFTLPALAQDEIDIVNPYEIKVSRSKEADTFYFTQHAQTGKQVQVDTLRTYDVFLEERLTPFGIAYMCNGSEITKKKYLEYKAYWNASGACKPCMLYTYDNKEQLKYAAFQYEDCLCGSYKEYYPDGTVKVEGQFKANTTGLWTNMKGRNLCSVRDGIWTYFFPDGVTEKTEIYTSGKLNEVIYPVSSSSDPGNIGQDSGENPEKKGVFQRLKDKNKPEQ